MLELMGRFDPDSDSEAEVVVTGEVEPVSKTLEHGGGGVGQVVMVLWTRTVTTRRELEAGASSSWATAAATREERVKSDRNEWLRILDVKRVTTMRQ